MGTYSPKLKIEEVVKIFAKEGYDLKTKKFINGSQKLICLCPNKHLWETTLIRFRYGYRCKKCSGKEKYNHSQVSKIFSDSGCKLLSDTYVDNNHSLKYICSCGNLATIKLRSFLEGKRCRACSLNRSMGTNKKNHGGDLYFQTETFKKEREKLFLSKYGTKNASSSEVVKRKTEENNLSKYGVKHVSQYAPINKKQRQGFIEKYGVSHFMNHPPSKEKFTKTLMQRYGVPSLAYLSRPASKQSQKLFFAIFNKLPNNLKEKCHFASLNGEFVVCYNKEYFKYDFVNTTMNKAIEFNGSSFHPREEQKDSDTGWCAFHPLKTVKEARDYERRKYKGLEIRNIKILTVWDYEYRKDFGGLVEKCLRFIMQDSQ